MHRRCLKYVLGGNELMLVRVLQKNDGGVMNRVEFETQCTALGMNVSSFYVLIGYSSLIEKLGTGVYCLQARELNRVELVI